MENYLWPGYLKSYEDLKYVTFQAEYRTEYTCLLPEAFYVPENVIGF